MSDDNEIQHMKENSVQYCNVMSWCQTQTSNLTVMKELSRGVKQKRTPSRGEERI